MSRVRVYHPETDEPFDLPEAKASDLILNQGWRKQPIDPNGIPAVTTTENPHLSDTQDWRDSEVGMETGYFTVDESEDDDIEDEDQEEAEDHDPQ